MEHSDKDNIIEAKARVEETTILPDDEERRNRQYTYAVYILYLAGFFTGVTVIIGLVLAYIKRGDMRATPYAAHMSHLIRTFWIALPFFLIGLVLSLILIGYVVIFFVSLWFLYRCLFGLIRLSENKPL